MADQYQDVEITSAETTTTTTIEEDGLELSLSLRPLNYSSSSSSSHHHNKNLPETSSPVSHVKILSKRDAQALCRREAKLRRELKRKASAKRDAKHEEFPQRRRKVLNLGFQGAPPPLLGCNAGGVNGGFRPYQGLYCNFGSQNEGKDGAASISSGSSSGISDNCQSVSGPGENSSDTGSHSSHPHIRLPPPYVQTSITSQLQHCSSQLDLQSNGYGSVSNHSKLQLCSSHSNKSELVAGLRQSSKSPEAVTSSNMTYQQNEPRSNSTFPRSITPEEAKGENGKPPKPVGLTGQQKLLFSQMPCVSTTGNGPNGKKISGFLYKYSKMEVTIICVCHGASFSPAGFVEHAGGVDVEYPLKHIRVVPFALS